MPSSARGEVRIIAGDHRGRKLKFTDQHSLRPTPDRVRETLFNWLQADMPGARCLDLYAGSGALGFESASRMAARVVMVERNPAVYSDLVTNRGLLDAATVQLVQDDALHYLDTAGQQFDIVFLDPPYQSELLCRSAELLQRRRCLSNHAKIYVEVDAQQQDMTGCLPASWRCIRSKTAGQVAYHLFETD